jgi:hypothetical protein
MRAFLFVNGQLQAVTTDQAGKKLPRPQEGEWEHVRQIADVTKELSAEEVESLKSEGFFLKKRS